MFPVIEYIHHLDTELVYTPSVVILHNPSIPRFILATGSDSFMGYMDNLIPGPVPYSVIPLPPPEAIIITHPSLSSNLYTLCPSPIEDSIGVRYVFHRFDILLLSSIGISISLSSLVSMNPFLYLEIHLSTLTW